MVFIEPTHTHTPNTNTSQLISKINNHHGIRIFCHRSWDQRSHQRYCWCVHGHCRRHNFRSRRHLECDHGHYLLSLWKPPSDKRDGVGERLLLEALSDTQTLTT
ncbi:hypothetical protein CYLTODRAFT_73969 [Cylindrobasidium torrendii FP15055 ss-10]|uniref:Uncharacterized protein n=1 Tax=Cylindrobasidium torrendii FP15055 ss-10 TaxID=1314674 RepID=A0A0D7B3V9_9AGAR|nr:hypothetical protein CYLTODRAFT_73969 [Cylindrobasidium torrendii FP15055 ss-10]